MFLHPSKYVCLPVLIHALMIGAIVLYCLFVTVKEKQIMQRLNKKLSN